MTREELLGKICYMPHPEVHSGEVMFILDKDATTSIDPTAHLDLTGSLTFGPYCMIGAGVTIFTHDHVHEGREPLLLNNNIKWQNKVIGRDVWFHDHCIVLYQVNCIPEGVIIGAGAVLTKNSEVPYGIYAGNPAILIGNR